MMSEKCSRKFTLIELLIVIAIIAILAALLLLHFGWQKWKGKAPSPIAMILVSAVLGMVVYH